MKRTSSSSALDPTSKKIKSDDSDGILRYFKKSTTATTQTASSAHVRAHTIMDHLHPIDASPTLDNHIEANKQQNAALCTECGCQKQARYLDGGTRGRCVLHGGYPLCTAPGCKTPQAFKDGGTRGRCVLHGGYPLCTVPGCKTPQQFKDGGTRGRCIVHGGYPLCTMPGCKTPQRFQDGGTRGRCIGHGGYPKCTAPNCKTPQEFKAGGVRARCAYHGGVPIMRCVYIDSSDQIWKSGCGSIECGHVVRGVYHMRKHIDNNHTTQAIQRKQRTELAWLRHLTQNAGFVIDNDQHARVDHCTSSSASFVSQDRTPRYSSRIDFFVVSLVPSFPYLLFVEIDEHYHRDRCLASEFARMQETLKSLSLDEHGNYPNRSHVIIRVNPDAFKADGVAQRISSADRQRQLVDLMKRDWSEQLVQGISVNLIYMFYPTSSQRVRQEDVSSTMWSKATNVVDGVGSVRLPSLYDESTDDYDLSENDRTNARLFKKTVIHVQ